MEERAIPSEAIASLPEGKYTGLDVTTSTGRPSPNADPTDSASEIASLKAALMKMERKMAAIEGKQSVSAVETDVNFPTVRGNQILIVKVHHQRHFLLKNLLNQNENPLKRDEARSGKHPPAERDPQIPRDVVLKVLINIQDDDLNYDEEAVILDWYNRDLSLIIDKETFLSAKPMTSEDFAYAWHGVRASYGFLRGRLFYEVKVEDHLAVPHLEGEQHPHIVRCGWSIDDAGMTLGEEPFSYGYDGRAKASTDLKIKDYGQPFGKGDVIGCFLDMDSNPVTMSFSVNGRNFGKCYEVSHRSLQGKALFPHILTKNCTFKVNFGSERPSFRLKSRYRFVGQIPLVEERCWGHGASDTTEF
ncbi:heterogeneous nuclear ribonucleoprotein U-like protein 1 [Macrobrachium nipponense]|uniref:heterogeneous nuclear ribonucleoprotein U-like protein 1 n=1 Tax=Macrobrachium nipponense TaxID=159736 RepID=UPI0030C7FDF7